jgi:multiple antibiotic resistance protein
VHFSAGPLVTDFLIGYMALFSIINPSGVSFGFLSMTDGPTEQARTHIARGVGVYSFIVLIVSLFIGSQIMRFFGITVPALRITGGLVVALSGWSMLTAPDDDDSATPPVPAHATQVENKIFFPLTVSLTTGPGAIATAIALGANRTGELREIVVSILASLLIAVLVAATVMVAYANASTFFTLGRACGDTCDHSALRVPVGVCWRADHPYGSVGCTACPYCARYTDGRFARGRTSLTRPGLDVADRTVARIGSVPL